MGKDSRIQWTHHTFNPWWGCEKISPACTFCYAERDAKRYGHRVWGKAAPRRFLGEKYWLEPHRWDVEAKHARERRRVFCASMADVFEAREDLDRWREKLWELIELTTGLDWLLLTKRPENIARMIRPSWKTSPPPNVWYGATVEDQRSAELRIPELLEIPAAVRFLSIEPLLGRINLAEVLNRIPLGARLNWVIVGGESGPQARPFDVELGRRILAFCRSEGIRIFVKQLGAKPLFAYYDDFKDEYCDRRGIEWPDPLDWDIEIDGQPPLDAKVILRFDDPKGGLPDEWPEDLRIREIPILERRA